MANQFLYEKLNNYFEMSGVKPDIPLYVSSNLPKKFELREYQEEALKYFIQSYETSTKNNKQIWNLFHMATGFRVIIVTVANSLGNIRVFELLPKLKTKKYGWCIA